METPIDTGVALARFATMAILTVCAAACGGASDPRLDATVHDAPVKAQIDRVEDSPPAPAEDLNLPVATATKETAARETE